VKITYYTGFWRLAYSLSTLFAGKKMLAVFTFHRITDSASGRRYLLNYDRGLDIQAYRRQIRLVTKFFHIVDLDEFIEIVTGKRNLSRHTALITFDDADSGLPERAFPILQKYHIPAVIFTPTAFIDSDRRFWHLLISNAVETADSEQWHDIQQAAENFPAPIKEAIKSTDPAADNDRMALCQHLVNALDKYDQAIIDEVATKIDRCVGNRYRLGIGCMSWEEQREWRKAGLRFESHTVTHRKLTNLSAAEIAKELTDSKAELEKQFGMPIDSICYPAGAFNEEVLTQAGRCGYKVGFTTRPSLCVYPRRGEKLYSIPRHTIYGDDIPEITWYFGRLLVMEYLRGKLG
jgi:peptidoglycan/xylan/chitin deacetylase (PgdA/CDA1 family)